jgi:ABC-type anion transport system duplicated permease subunit
MRRRISLSSVIWLIVGILLATSHHYLRNVDNIKPLISAVLAILLWPLLLLGINLHVR